MVGILNRRISTKAGIIILFLIAAFVGSTIIRQYKKIMEMRFEAMETEVFEKPVEGDL